MYILLSIKYVIMFGDTELVFGFVDDRYFKFSLLSRSHLLNPDDEIALLAQYFLLLSRNGGELIMDGQRHTTVFMVG